MANQDRVNFVWAESALTTIPPIPVSEVAYRDTTQTPEQMEVGQQYDTIYNSARHNQLLFLLTSVAKTLCENGIMPFLAGQEYSQYARCIFTDGKLYIASRAILANEQPYPTPGDDSGVWIAEETSENLVPNSRRVIAGTGLTGGGPLSSDVTLSAKLDGKTTQAAADGAITVKDVAIGRDLGDLASARGQIGDNIRINTASDLNAYTKAGNWLFSDAAAGENFPNIGRGGELNCYVSTTAIFQFFTEFNNNRRYIRYGIPNSTWTNWIQFISVAQLGDGIRNTNGIISVPEYEGATASSAGTSGLVPPAAARQHESFLTGGGEYKPALTKISDSVNLADSKTAASAKAVKTTYDLANSKQANLGFTPVQQGGGTGQGSDKIYIGYSKSGLKAQADTLDLGNIVTTSAGCMKAPSAANADYATSAGTTYISGNHVTWNWNGQEGQPEWLWGGNEATRTQMYVYNPANFSVNFASTARQTTAVPNVAFVGRDGAIPNGGTWLYVYLPYDSHYLRGVTLAGGATAPSNDGGIAIRVA